MRIDLTAPTTRQYAGHEWLITNLAHEKKGVPSALGRRVADLMGELALGLYHLPKGALYDTDWSNTHHIEMSLENGYVTLCTVDSNFLTRLVFLAHDYGMRVEIRPRTFRHLTLLFWQREVRSGSISQRCPTAEDALAAHRTAYPMPTEVTE